MGDLKISEGEWSVGMAYDNTGYPIYSIHGVSGKLSKEERQANRDLIAEAGTVANETGLTPRQLLEQRDELLKVVKSAFSMCDKITIPLESELESMRIECREAIEKTKK